MPLMLEWRVPDAMVLARTLAAAGLPVQAGPGEQGACLVPFDTLVLRLSSAPRRSAAHLGLAEAAPLTQESTPAGPSREGPVALAVGWATVDAERAARAFPDRVFATVGEDETLGARVLAAPGEPALLVLEPVTEGGLAAALARYGEGPVALYVAKRGPPTTPRPAMAVSTDGGAAGRLRWPLGEAAVLIRPPRPWGPFVIMVE